MPQEHGRTQHHEQEEIAQDDTERRLGKASVSAAVAEETDAILDVIDEILEEEGVHNEQDAQEYMNGFWQKGGE